MIKKAIQSVLSTGLKINLYIIDNSSSPELGQHLKEFPINYCFTRRNVGFGKGHNIALKRAEPSKYFLFLNPDVIVHPKTITKLAQYMDDNPEVGLVCPKVHNPDGTIQHLNKRHPTIAALLLRRFLPHRFSKYFHTILDHYEMMDVGYDELHEVPCMSGSFMFCRRSSIEAIGGFDPDYFLYFEDFDLTKRFQKNGFRTVFNPNASITHYWGKASHRSWRMTLIFAQSLYRFFNKWGWKLY